MFNDNGTDAVRINIMMKYSGETIDRIIKQRMRVLYQHFKNEKRVKVVLQYETTKLPYFTNTKDKICLLSQLAVVYKFFVLVGVLLIFENRAHFTGKYRRICLLK